MEPTMMDNLTPLLAYNVWLSLTQETRAKLAKLFTIPRTGEVIVRSGPNNMGGEVTSDGYSPRDLYAISVEKMQELTKSDSTNFYDLFRAVVENIDEISNPKAVAEIKQEMEERAAPVEVKKKSKKIKDGQETPKI